MGYLYHYCTIETLKAIIENKTLRLSDISKSNDSKEIDFLFDEYCKWVLKKGQNSDTSRLYSSSTNHFKSEQMDNTTFLVFCFSSKKDDLHMWSCYGNEGVSIKFNKDKLDNYINTHIGLGISEKIKTSIPDLQSSPIKLELKKVNYYSKNSIAKYFDENKLDGNIDDFKKIFKDSPFCKSDFFKCEKETRLVYTHIHDVNSTNNVNYLSLLDNDKVTDKIYFEYISTDKYLHKMIIDLPIETNLIESIMLGPNCKLTKKDIKELLLINGIYDDIEVDRSKGSYR